MATIFQIVVPVGKRKPDVVFAARLKAWCSWAGPPRAVLTDLGDEFQDEFGQDFELMNVRMLNTAAVSPTQNAHCERAGGSW